MHATHSTTGYGRVDQPVIGSVILSGTPQGVKSKDLTQKTSDE